MDIQKYPGIKNGMQVQINYSPGVPVPFNPVNPKSYVRLPVFFEWSRVKNADTYHLQVSSSDTFDSIIMEVYNIKGCIYFAGVVRFVPGLSYYWRVRGMNERTAGKFSDVCGFKIGL